MKEQVKLIVEKAIEIAEKTGQFALDQAPDIINQFIKWKITMYSIRIAVFSVLIYITYKLSLNLLSSNEAKEGYNIHKLGRYWNKESKYDDYVSYRAFIIINIILNIIYIPNIYYSIMYLMQALFFPKIYLIEYFIR